MDLGRLHPALTPLWGAGLALALAGCAHPAPEERIRPLLDEHHAEPELVSVVHVVMPGQTLYRIAHAYEIPVDELMAANGIEDPRTLAVGQKLLVPGAAEPRPVLDPPDAGAKPPEADPEPPPAASRPRPRPRTSAPATRPGQGKGDLDWPVRGVLYARFGRKGGEPHDGIDLAAPLGTPVKTAGEGTVLYAGEQPGYGRIAIVEHPGGLITLYAHNRDLRVKSGQKVRRGQVIATVGESGRTSGPHLHFEVRKGGVPVDPLEHLGPIPPVSPAPPPAP